MPETPPMIRGQMYNTHLWQRCYEYHQCKRCMQCAHYNPHNALCLACEAGKPKGKECKCTDSMQHAVIRLEEITGRPLFDINAAAGKNVTIDRGSVCFNNENARLVRAINEEG